MNSTEQQAKWDHFYTDKKQSGNGAAVLTENLDLLPLCTQSMALTSLDVACGLAANGLLLAERGFKSHCWDISPVVINTTKKVNSDLEAIVRDIERYPPEENMFDVIVVSRFLHRPLCQYLATSLKPGGRLFYQTFALLEDDTVPITGPKNPQYRLKRGELLALFSTLKVLRYKEAPLAHGQEAEPAYESWLVAEKL